MHTPYVCSLISLHRPAALCYVKNSKQIQTHWGICILLFVIVANGPQVKELSLYGQYGQSLIIKTSICQCPVIRWRAIYPQSNVAVNISCGQDPTLCTGSASTKYGKSMDAKVEPLMRNCLSYDFVYDCSYVNCLGDRGYVLTCGLLATIIHA